MALSPEQDYSRYDDYTLKLAESLAKYPDELEKSAALKLRRFLLESTGISEDDLLNAIRLREEAESLMQYVDPEVAKETAQRRLYNELAVQGIVAHESMLAETVLEEDSSIEELKVYDAADVPRLQEILRAVRKKFSEE